MRLARATIEISPGFSAKSPRPQQTEREAECTAGEREEQAFGEQLTNDATPTGADGGANGELALPHGRANQHQVGDVGTRDEQHARDGTQQYRRGVRTSRTMTRWNGATENVLCRSMRPGNPR